MAVSVTTHLGLPIIASGTLAPIIADHWNESMENLDETFILTGHGMPDTEYADGQFETQIWFDAFGEKVAAVVTYPGQLYLDLFSKSLWIGVISYGWIPVIQRGTIMPFDTDAFDNIDTIQLLELENAGWHLADGSTIPTPEGDFVLADCRGRLTFCALHTVPEFESTSEKATNNLIVGGEYIVELLEENLPSMAGTFTTTWTNNDYGWSASNPLDTRPVFMPEHGRFPDITVSQLNVDNYYLNPAPGGAQLYVMDESHSLTTYYSSASGDHAHTISFGSGLKHTNLPPNATKLFMVKL